MLLLFFIVSSYFTISGSILFSQVIKLLVPNSISWVQSVVENNYKCNVLALCIVVKYCSYAQFGCVTMDSNSTPS
jgi:hypothetical protein